LPIGVLAAKLSHLSYSVAVDVIVVVVVIATATIILMQPLLF